MTIVCSVSGVKSLHYSRILLLATLRSLSVLLTVTIKSRLLFLGLTKYKNYCLRRVIFFHKTSNISIWSEQNDILVGLSYYHKY